MKAKHLVLSMILTLGFGQGCRASFQTVDKGNDQSGDQTSGNGEGGAGEGSESDGIAGGKPESGDQKPGLDPTPNPIGGAGVTTPTTTPPGDPNGPGKGDPNGPGKGDPVDPIGDGKGKLSLTVTLPQPSIKMGEKKIQATARLNTEMDPPRVRWSIMGPPGQMVLGSIDPSGIYTSPQIIDRSFTLTVIATLIADPTVFGSAPLLVEPLTGNDPNKPILTVTTPVDTVKAGENKVPAKAALNTQMTAPSVTWSIVPPANTANPGTIDQNGVYTSPKDVALEFPVTIVATLKSDPSVIGIKAIIVKPLVDPNLPKPTLAVTLPSPEIKAGGDKMQAVAKLSSQAEPPVVTWSIKGPAGRADIGTISAGGVYTSPVATDAEFTVIITATLNSDPTIFGTASLRVLPKEVIFARCTRGSVVFPILAYVYTLPPKTSKLPNFGNPAEARKVQTVCMDQYAVKPRDFEGGFPDVSDLIEWFALSTTTQILIPKDGEYTFYLNSDDGSKLYINGDQIIDNDGVHSAQGTEHPLDSPTSGEKEGKVQLKQGLHDLKVDYFQGPRYRIALELRWKIPGSNTKQYVPRENFK